MRIPKKYTHSWRVVIITAFIPLINSCSELIRIPLPDNQLMSQTVYTNIQGAQAAMNGIYSEMMNNSNLFSGGPSSITVLTGLSSDEFENHSSSPERIAFFQNSLIEDNSILLNSLWESAYKYIYYANAINEGLQASSSIDPVLSRQLEAEARFVRAFCHFYLVNLFGAIPIVSVTDYRLSRQVSRSPVNQVFSHMTEDLIFAREYLPEDYKPFSNERIRPTKWAASAMLARIYLYNKDWENAEKKASEVISQTQLFGLEQDCRNVFLKNSREAIWQLMPVVNTMNTREGNTFILVTNPIWITLSKHVLNSFEKDDLRRTNWTDSISVGKSTFFYPYKYKIRTGGTPLDEYSVVLRLAEQYLIRSEAKTMQGDFEGALQDLNTLRDRAGLNPLNRENQVLSQESTLNLIEQERRVELFAEWGHRWFDLKRTGRADAILKKNKPGWDPTDILFPIPQYELLNNSNLTPNP